MGGSDDGILYALKAINITRAIEKEKNFNEDFLTAERKVSKFSHQFLHDRLNRDYTISVRY